MQDKYIGILRNNNFSITTSELIAQELHALRYEVARQVVEEYYAQAIKKSSYSKTFWKRQRVLAIDCLSEQGETITIGREDK